jgi:hypothetical protein
MRRSDDTLRSRDASFQETDRWQGTIYVPDWAMGIIVGVLAAVVILIVSAEVTGLVVLGRFAYKWLTH